MAEQISRLVATADLQASKFQTGSQQVTAAEQAMVAGAREVSATITDMTGKISASGDGLSRLSRQYDVVGFNQAKFAREVNQLGRALDTGKVKMEAAERILIGMNQRLGMTANSSDLAAKGQLTLASAVERANAQIARQNAMPANTASGANDNVASRRQVFGYQAFDIGQGLLSGAPLGMIAAQQGPQIAQLYAAQGGLNALWKDSIALLGGLVRAAGPWIATGAAIYGVYRLIIANSAEAKLKIDAETEALAAQAMPVGQLKSSIGELASLQQTYQTAIANTGKVSDSVTNSIITNTEREFKAKKALLELEKLRQEAALKVNEALIAQKGLELRSAVSQGVNTRTDLERQGFADPRAGSIPFVRLPDSITGLDKTNATIESNPVYQELKRLRAEGELTKIQFDALKEALNATFSDTSLIDKGTDAMKRYRIEVEETREGLRDQRELGSYVAKRNAEASQVDAQFAADQQMARARTNAERLAAIEMQVRSRARQDGDRDGGLQARVDRALQAERNRQQIELRDEADARHRAQARSVEAAREDLSLIGATVGEAARLRYEFSEIARLKEEAARRGGLVSEDEVKRVKETAEALSKAADAAARINLNRDLLFERDQMGRSQIDQQIASRLQGANLPIDFTSPEAQLIRSNLQQQEWRDSVRGFMGDFQRELMSSGGNVGKAFGSAILNSLMNSTQKAWDKFADAVADLFGKMLGIGGMGGSGGTASLGSSVVGAMIGAANDNNRGGLKTSDFAPMALSGIGSPGDGSLLGNAPYSVANATSFIKQYASSIGIDPDIALKVARSEGLGAGIWQSNYSKGGFREPSFGPFQLLKGGQGTGFGTGLGNTFMKQTGLDPADPANWQKSTAFALDQAKASGWGAWYGAKNQGITGFMGIDQGAVKATSALDKLATSSTETAKSLAGGLGQLGGALNQFPGAPGGGGGLLGSLLGGGLNSAFSGTAAFNWLSANPGGAIGLFAEGGVSDRPAIFGDGDGPEAAVPLSRGRYIPVEMRMPRNMGGGGISGLNITWGVDADQQGNLTPYIKKVVQQDAPALARKESSKAVGNYAYGQRQGGAAADSQRYQRLKRKN